MNQFRARLSTPPICPALQAVNNVFSPPRLNSEEGADDDTAEVLLTLSQRPSAVRFKSTTSVIDENDRKAIVRTKLG